MVCGTAFVAPAFSQSRQDQLALGAGQCVADGRRAWPFFGFDIDFFSDGLSNKGYFGWKFGQTDGLPWEEDGQSFDQILKLAYIAWPVVGSEYLAYWGVNKDWEHPFLVGILQRKMLS